MRRIRQLAGRHPLVTFYALTFTLSWGGMLLVVGGPGNIPGHPERAARLMPEVVMALIVGPAASGILLTAMTSGRAGLRELADRLLAWSVPARWYAVALLTAPVAMATVLLPLSHLSSAFVPGIATAHDRGTLLLMALGAVGVGGLLEELGWTGFVVPRLLERRSVLVTGLIVGVLWQAWHFLVNLWFSSVASGPIAPWSFILPYFVVGIAQLTAFRVLMIWVYSRSKSLLLAVLMHGSLIASTAVPVLTPPAVGVDFLAWFLGVAVVLWVAVGIVAIACPGQLGAKRSLEGAARGSRLQAAGPLRRGTTNAVEPG